MRSMIALIARPFCSRSVRSVPNLDVERCLEAGQRFVDRILGGWV
jgi:hypothetical protein